MLHVVLFEPEIPGNTGNIIRLCANTGAQLHLVRPLGFEIDDARLRRAGLDYHEWASLHIHDDWAAAQMALGARRCWALTTKATHSVFDVAFADEDVLVFGPESRGLPVALREGFGPTQGIRLPMRPDSRSLNLANAVAVTVYEAWRQLGLPGGQ